MTQTPPESTTTHSEVRDFHIDVPEVELVDLRRRIAATRWPEKETVEDQSQGVQLATIQELARYWASEYDWRKCEAKLNALPQFIRRQCDSALCRIAGREVEAMLWRTTVCP